VTKDDIASVQRSFACLLQHNMVDEMSTLYSLLLPLRMRGEIRSTQVPNNSNYRETQSPIFNVSLTEENCGTVIADMLMECAERLGNFPNAQIDSRAWSHLLVYAPKETK
jgi:hypothetical protein